MKVRISKVPVPKAQNGANPNQTSELESGEVYKDIQGDVNKIPDSAPTHENDGVKVDDVHKVLEDTADKRTDKDSKILKMSPDEVENTVGFRPKTSLTHSKAFEKAREYWDKQIVKIQNKLESSYNQAQDTNSPYSKNSIKHNVQRLGDIPTQDQLFENLFEHQEMTKQKYNISDGGNRAQYGYNSEQPNNNYLLKLRTRAVSPDATPTDIEAFQRAFHDAHPSEALDIISQFPTTNKGKRYGLTNNDVSSNDDSLYGPRTEAYYYASRNLDSPKGNIAGRFNPTPDQIGTGMSEGNFNIPQDDAQGYVDGSVGDFQPYYGLQNNQQGSTSNRFNQPLRWYDLAGPLMKLADNGRIGTKYNSVNLRAPQVRQLDVRPELEANQASFNSMKNILANSATGNANLANLASQKYRVDNQLIGQYENLNKSKKDQADQILAETANKQQLLDQQARSVQEQQQLKGIDAQRLNKISSIDNIANRFAQNAKLNREGNLLMHMINYFDQNGDYNGKKYNFTLPSGTLPSTQQQNTNVVNIGNNPYTGQPEYRYKIQLPSGKSIYVKPSTKQLPMGNNVFGR